MKSIKKQNGFSKLILIIIILVVVLLGAGGAVTAILFAGGDDDAVIEDIGVEENAENPEDEKSENVDAQGNLKQALFWSIEPPLVVNYDNFGKKGYLQVAISVMTYDGSVLDRVNKNSPVIRHSLIVLFNGRKYGDLIGPENQLRMQQECLDEINRVLVEFTGHGGVNNVYFTNYVMQ